MIRAICLSVLTALLTQTAGAQDDGLPGGPKLTPRGKALAAKPEPPVVYGRSTDDQGRQWTIHAVPKGESDWSLRVAPPGKPATPASPAYQPQVHGSSTGGIHLPPRRPRSLPDSLASLHPIPGYLLQPDFDSKTPSQSLYHELVGGKLLPEAVAAHSKGLKVYGTDAYRKKIKKILDVMSSTETGKGILKRLAESGKTTLIADPRDNDNHAWAAPASKGTHRRDDGKAGPGGDALVGLGGLGPPGWLDDPRHMIYAADILAHELIHATHMVTGETFNRSALKKDEPRKGTPLEEERTVGLGEFADDPLTENRMRKDLGKLYPNYAIPTRTQYFIDPRDPNHDTWKEVMGDVQIKKPAPAQAQPKKKGAARALDERF